MVSNIKEIKIETYIYILYVVFCIHILNNNKVGSKLNLKIKL